MRLKAFKIDDRPPLKKLNSRSRDMAIEMCLFSAYLVRGVFKVFRSSELNQLTEQGEDGFIRELCYYAEDFVEWRRTEDIEYEEMTDGIYLYEEAEVALPKMLRKHFVEHELMPTSEEFLGMVKAIYDQHQKENA